MDQKRFILVNIGCIECGVSSNVVGVFTCEEEANKLAEQLDHKCGWRQGGQNSFEVFPMPEDNVINEEYRPALNPQP